MRKCAVISKFICAFLFVTGAAFSQQVKPAFSPLLPQDTVIVPARVAITGSIGTVPEVKSGKENTPQQVFRIQLLTSNQYSEASFARKVAEELFKDTIEVAYDAPYYKLRVGQFVTRQEAERQLPRIQSFGYPNAIVVAAIIGIQKSLPTYDISDTTAIPAEGKR